MHQVHLRHTPAPIHPTYGYHYFTISLIDTITHLERIQNSDWKELWLLSPAAGDDVARPFCLRRKNCVCKQTNHLLEILYIYTHFT
jgi:hypothetical protein